jgi:hypothetical protein
MTETQQTGVPACGRCYEVHPARFACDERALSRQAALRRGLPDPGLDSSAPWSPDRLQRARLRPSAISFGWFGRVLCTIPPYFILIGFGGFTRMPMHVFLLTLGAPMLCFSLWWTKRVWESPMKRR